MDSKNIIGLLSRSAANQPVPSEDCSGPTELAAFLEGGLSVVQRKLIQGHLAGCDFCIEQVATLSRARELELLTTLPEATMERAQSLVNTHKQSHLRWASRWAVAALLVLTIGVVFKPVSDRQTVPGQTPVVSDQLADIPQIRSIDRPNVGPEIIIPSSGQALPVNEPVFEWTAVQGSLYYDVRLVSAEGETVWEERVKSTRRALPGDLQLQAGTDYYLRVDAYLAEAKRVSSRHVLFSTQEQH